MLRNAESDAATAAESPAEAPAPLSEVHPAIRITTAAANIRPGISSPPLKNFNPVWRVSYGVPPCLEFVSSPD
jgi:hypothetical protein